MKLWYINISAGIDFLTETVLSDGNYWFNHSYDLWNNMGLKIVIED
jgi:hypothetical protein